MISTGRIVRDSILMTLLALIAFMGISQTARLDPAIYVQRIALHAIHLRRVSNVLKVIM